MPSHHREGLQSTSRWPEQFEPMWRAARPLPYPRRKTKTAKNNRSAARVGEAWADELPVACPPSRGPDRSHPVGKGLTSRVPGAGQALDTDVRPDDATDDRTGRIDVPTGARRRPERLLEIGKVPGGGPQRERHRVLRTGLAPITQLTDRDLRMRNMRQPSGRPDTVTHPPGRHIAQDLIEKRPRLRPIRTRRQRGGDRDSNRPSHPLRMSMRDLRRPRRLHRRLSRIIPEPGAKRRDPHRGTVTPRTLAFEQTNGQLTPRAALSDQPQQPVHTRAIATIKVVTLGKARRQHVLVNTTRPLQHGHDRAGHLRVVSPLPRPRRKTTPLQNIPMGRHEELRTQ